MHVGGVGKCQVGWCDQRDVAGGGGPPQRVVVAAAAAGRDEREAVGASTRPVARHMLWPRNAVDLPSRAHLWSCPIGHFFRRGGSCMRIVLSVFVILVIAADTRA